MTHCGSSVSHGPRLAQASKPRPAPTPVPVSKYSRPGYVIARSILFGTQSPNGETMTHAPQPLAAAAQLAPPPARPANDLSGSFSAIAAVGAAFVGFLSYGRSPDALTTGIAMGVTFVGAIVALHVLHFVFRLAVMLAKVAIPVLVILLVGCALDWPVAESAAHWLWSAGHDGAELAARGWSALRAG